MTAAVYGLGAAVVVAVVYVALTERLDYVSFYRRQLDTWAAAAAFLCLTGILWGGAEARRAWQPPTRPSVPLVITPAREIPRLRTPDLQRPADGPVEMARAAPPTARPVSAPGSVPLPSPTAVPTEPRPPFEGRVVRAGSEPPAPAEVMLPTATATAVAVALATDPTAPTAVQRLLPSATPTRAAARRVPTLTPRPTAPRRDPPAPPTPSERCGDPERIRLEYDFVEAEIDRTEADPRVLYRVDVTNRSEFPVTLVDIVVHALSGPTRSETLAVDYNLPDIQIEPGATISIDRHLVLERLPSVFGETDLCIGFAAESCDRRANPPLRRCMQVRGF